MDPLLKIALVADFQAYGEKVIGGWFDKAVNAMKDVYNQKQETESIGIRLLREIKKIFDETQQDALPSKDIVRKLKEDEESPWDELTPRKMANLLKPSDIKSQTVRFQATLAKGYIRTDFEDAWKRYL